MSLNFKRRPFMNRAEEDYIKAVYELTIEKDEELAKN